MTGERIAAAGVELDGDLALPDGARAVTIFAHGSGSGRGSPRNRRVADELNEAGIGALLIDLLTPEEDAVDRATRQFRFDVHRLGARVTAAADWVHERTQLPVAYFGASTGAAAALLAAAERPDAVAVVSRGGRPDLAGKALARVRAPTLLIVGGADPVVLDLNRSTLAELTAEAKLEVVPGAGHLFEEPGALDEVARLTRDWIAAHLPGE